MWRVSSRRLVFDRLARTRIGAEALTLTQRDMRAVGRKSSWLVRTLARRRRIDALAVYVDGPLRASLHPSFVYVTRALTALVCAPVCVLLVTGVLQPTYYLLVPTGLVTAQTYGQMWQFAHWAVVLAGQLALCLLLYDASVYIRYPCFAYVVAPLYRACGLVRATPHTVATAAAVATTPTTKLATRRRLVARVTSATTPAASSPSSQTRQQRPRNVVDKADARAAATTTTTSSAHARTAAQWRRAR